MKNQEKTLEQIYREEEIYREQVELIEYKIQRIKTAHSLPWMDVSESRVCIFFRIGTEINELCFKDEIGTFSMLKGLEISIDKRALRIILKEYVGRLSAKLSRIEEEKILNQL